MTIEATSKEDDYSKQSLLITSKAGTSELLINYFKQHYGNERTAADNEVAIVIYRQAVDENGLGLNRPHHYYQIIQEEINQQ